jgi:hypothetical protein
MPKIQVLPIYEFGEEPLKLDEWFCSLIWCPSQCFMHKQVGNKHYILYLRWRHQNPWQATIVENAYNEPSMHHEDSVWRRGLFEKRGLEFTDEEVKEARKMLLRIWEELYAPKKDNKYGGPKRRKKHRRGSRR